MNGKRSTGKLVTKWDKFEQLENKGIKNMDIRTVWLVCGSITLITMMLLYRKHKWLIFRFI